MTVCFFLPVLMLTFPRWPRSVSLQMLTGDIIPTSGTASLNGLDILKQQNDVRRLLGYCPQFDSLVETLTGREHLVLFARIKGVAEDIIPEYIEHLLTKLGLQEGIVDKPTKGYSGGNKRKLCVGIALIGNPVRRTRGTARSNDESC